MKEQEQKEEKQEKEKENFNDQIESDHEQLDSNSSDSINSKKDKNLIFVADRPPLNNIPAWAFGVFCTVNFVIFWAIPIFGQGQFWKLGFKKIGSPIYQMLDNNPVLRNFAKKYIYTVERNSDYFAQSLLVFFSIVPGLLLVFSYQLYYGYLPFWLIFIYYNIWVGFGGRVMGGAYSFAHKEGHDVRLYKPWFKNTIGNLFECVLGPFFGNVPYNFSTSHIAIHHKLNAGRGDTFYQWDFDRTSWSDLMYYQTRILTYFTGISSLIYFKKNSGIITNSERHYNLLFKGMVLYWIVYPAIVLGITRSLTFFFFIYLQPLFCMTYFLAFINYGYHAFIEFDKEGKHIRCVNATCIQDGEDDYFGEDDHMAHHYSTTTFWRDLPKYRLSKNAEFSQYHASVFRDMSIVELSFLVLLQKWDLLADKYVDHSGKLTKNEIMEMLKVRAKRIELDPTQE